ncbi:MAG: ABC transporter ATP-binding protein [Spirochaetaceae bacterium]|nr:MAG: ABC transporter ATP-binding protein [Spirochaetaceae bacterium]
MIRRVLVYYRPYWYLLASDLIAVTLIAALTIAVPYLLKVMVDTLIPAGDLKGIFRLGLLVTLMMLAKYGCNFYTLYAGHLMAVKMEKDMRRDLFYHLQSLSFRFFDNRQTGELMSRMINDIGRVTDAVNHAPEDIFLAVSMILGSYIVLFTLNWKLALICLLPVPIMAAYSGLLGGRIRRGFQGINDAIAEINAKVENIISGIRIMQSFTREKQEREHFDHLNRSYYRSWRSVLWILGSFYGGVFLMQDVSRLVIIVAGGLFVISGALSLGTLVAFIFYVGIYLEPIERLSRTVEMVQRMGAGLKRFFEIMDEKPDIREVPGAAALKAIAGRIDFENVTFSYDTRRHVLRNLNLTIAPGSVVALVGPSGAGKTTFCHLIPRFYEPEAGRVLVDGMDVGRVSLKSLREAIGIVQQDVFLFTGTIRDNIAYGKPGATLEEIEQAARRAGAHSFIHELPAGYDTHIGEKGVKLSGGQKQRVSIARAFLKNPRILILDEATSSLDTHTEMIIQEALEKLIEGRTTLIIAHRLSTIRNADEIVVLTEAGIVQRGTHAQLIGQAGLYADLYNAQTGLIPDEE